MISRKHFMDMAKTLRGGRLKACPCCGWKGLELTTDDRHEYFIIECSKCRIMSSHAVYGIAMNAWNRRVSRDPLMHRYAAVVEAEYFMPVPEIGYSERFLFDGMDK